MNDLRRWMNLLCEAKQETLVMYHGTALDNVPNILRHGLLPSERGEGTGDRWATLGGVYLSQDREYAINAASGKYPNQKLAVIVVEVNTRHATPDEDVVEKALIKAFTSALDQWGIDDAYEADIEYYANHEEERTPEWDEKPFNREQFFKDFWHTVFQNMSSIAGTPRKRAPELVATAANLAVQLEDQDLRGYVNLAKWQAIKTQLVALYPRLRSTAQHAKSGLAMAYNIRVTKPIPPSHILRVMTHNDSDEWHTLDRRAISRLTHKVSAT